MKDTPQQIRPSDLSQLKSRRVLWPLFAGLTLFVIAAVPALPLPYRETEVLIAAVGGIWALAFYLHQRHAEDARFMKELMREFNERYDKMNGPLQSAIDKKEPFTDAERLQFIDYFNLCAEEWVFWKLGYIYEPIWRAWENGMRHYGRDSRVACLWAKEREPNSYYGFEFPIT